MEHPLDRHVHPGAEFVFAATLRRQRLAAGLTQRDLAVRAGISARAISDLERGINRHPQRETARLLSVALNLQGEAAQRFTEAARRRPPADPAALTAMPPPAHDALIGREQELALVSETLLRTNARLVTLTGPGGVGKTRLAREIAWRLGPRFPAGIPFVRLDGLHESALIFPTMAGALGVPTTGDERTVMQRIAAQLSAGEHVIILDNMEHLLEAAPALAGLVQLLSAGCILVTSREALRVADEQVIPVRPLPLPEAHAWRSPQQGMAITNPAMKLFVRRARSHCADLPLDTNNVEGRANLASIAELCHRLDGLPLAIELAAAQTPAFSPQAICTTLADAGLPLLAGGPRDQPARLQTMEASIAWSYGELDEHQQRAFRALAVFAAGFSLPAATAVLSLGDTDSVLRIDPGRHRPALDPAVLAMVRSLTRKHLVVPDDSVPAHSAPRFRMLEPIRLFALQQLREAGEDAPVRLRHARYFTELAAILDPLTIGAEIEMRLEQQRIDLDNFRSAIDWALAAGEGDLAVRTTGNVAQFWKLRGHQHEARQRIAAALQVDEQSTPTDRWFLRFWGVTFAIEAGDLHGARALAGELLQIGLAAGDPLGAGVGHAMLSRALGELPGRSDEAADHAARAVDILEPLGRAEWTGLAWLRLGVERHRAGHCLAARDALLRALELRRVEPFAGLVASALISLGAVWLDLGEARAALDAYQEALRTALVEENQAALLGALLGLADVAWFFGDGMPETRMRTAMALAAAAERHRREHGIGREAIPRSLARWSVLLREACGATAVEAAYARGMALARNEIVALASQIRLAPLTPGGAAPAPGVTLISGFGSMQ